MAIHLIKSLNSKCTFWLYCILFIPSYLIAADNLSQPFSAQTVVNLAERLSYEAYQPAQSAPNVLQQLDYSNYRKIQFQKNAAIWGNTKSPFSIELFAPGYLFKELVEINVVELGKSYPLRINSDSFIAPDETTAKALSNLSGFGGFRLHFPLNSNDYADEFTVFQGASYFRAVSKGQLYGISTRGLAIDVAQSKGEEFPVFKKFWIERPARNHNSIVVHALLDSESITGAYRFGIYPNDPSYMEVTAKLFPRKKIEHIGIAPLTSMFMHNAMVVPAIADYRPAVHDSEALAIRLHNDEALWRPLNNPKRLQTSVFMDPSIKGFGLIQRHRHFADYQDLEAKYHARPSVWIKPQNNWGAGSVQLIEIPSNSEGNDNIVAYWQPEQALLPGKIYTYSYQISWPNDVSPMPNKTRIVRSAMGNKLFSEYEEVVIDLSPLTEDEINSAEIHTSVSKGKVIETQLIANPHNNGGRLFMSFDPEGAKDSEIRIQLLKGTDPVAETFLYRWLDSPWPL